MTPRNTDVPTYLERRDYCLENVIFKYSKDSREKITKSKRACSLPFQKTRLLDIEIDAFKNYDSDADAILKIPALTTRWQPVAQSSPDDLS